MKFLLQRTSGGPVYRRPGAYRDGRTAYGHPAWYIDFASLEELLAFCPDEKGCDALIIQKLDAYERASVPNGIEFCIEIYDDYRE